MTSSLSCLQWKCPALVIILVLLARDRGCWSRLPESTVKDHQAPTKNPQLQSGQVGLFTLSKHDENVNLYYTMWCWPGV